MTHPKDTQNPLARSRLEAARKTFATSVTLDDYKERYYKDAKTIIAAMDALLTPTVTDEMVNVGSVARYTYDKTCSEIYQDMIAERTKE